MEQLVMTAEAKTAENDISVITVKGYLDVITAEEVDVALNSLITHKYVNIVIDLSAVEYISSTGWGVFLSKIKEIRELGGDLKLAGMQPDVFEVFRILEFEWFLNSHSTIDEAILEFTQHHKPHQFA